MEYLSKKIGFKMAKELGVSEQQGEVFAYGVFALIQITLSLCLVIIIGSLFDVAIEALIISITSSILRKYSGGVHASKPSNCILIGTILCITQAVLIKYFIFYKISLIYIILIIITIFPMAYYIIFKYAPVDTPKKRIKTEVKKKRMKKNAFIVLGIDLMLVLLIMLISVLLNKFSINIYILCICIGVLWQVFTLTKVAHVLLKYI
ncbi:accessory gene regulator ArgB-like protein [Clostridium tarantellae]|uniref:Accessory regulator AgrB n=1 Tax=Clostridium tarantellae TaxID=39493 RepID=A0A6I1MVP1_9CLOT|nr:accessory gene regulator B family protein [Clostridium tarantellae]MPQ44901.1 accessory regulator AgrB [Clostridium tarantellae]